ncbi:MAG: nucleotidyl transferase AbiEii/AbiGii toxin family protein [Chloroflexi bacterium]|nr:nucleotidyl transferase AbiEii/AbiGii toxin family protein [Chloroflexota bacterium]
MLDNPRIVSYDLAPPMIGFGELRRLATHWHTDLAAVERVYAITCLLKGLFDHADLARVLVLRGSAALRYAYCADYPSIVEPECTLIETGEVSAWLDEAVRAASAGGVAFKLTMFERGAARVEFVGPLGRRSAAQPRITLSLIAGQMRLSPARVPLLSPFSDKPSATVSVIALEEWMAERVALFATAPRARDVFDAWFAVTHAPMDHARMLALARQIAKEKQIAFPTAGAHNLSGLGRVWEKALREIPARPSLEQVIQDFERELTW